MAPPPPAGTAGLNVALDFESIDLPAGVTLRSVTPTGVTARIDTPGPEDQSRFTLPEDGLALFDCLTDTSRLRVQLTGPDGVAGRHGREAWRGRGCQDVEVRA